MREQGKKASKNDIESRACSQKNDVSHTNSSIYFFLQLNLSFLVSHKVLIILQRPIRKTYPIAYQYI